MSLYLRRLVSGHKARFRDHELDIELDLAYVTDKVVVMGFPAVGVESIYRNHRADVQRFLSARHGSDFWVFNFCPARENAYPDTVFGGHVSRYPFPDHHVPPFLYFSLVTREIHTWLSGSDSRVAVLHCKAGKGRSGTLACAYLLSRYAPPSTSVPRSLHESFSQWSLIGDKEGLQTPTTESPAAIDQKPAPVPVGPDLSRVSSEPMVNTLEQVLDLHTSRRMKPSLHPSRYHPDVPLAKKPKMGVSIPSQQRWLFYWSQVLVGGGPPSLRPATDHPQAREHQVNESPRPTKVRLTKLTVRMREPSRMQPHLVQAASIVITHTGRGRAVGEATSRRLWASLSRYSDRLVDELRHSEDESHGEAGTTQTTPFKDDRWDKPKMIRSFTRMVSDAQSTDEDDSMPVVTYVLRPMSETEGEWVRVSVPSPKRSQEDLSTAECSHISMSLPVEDDSEDMSGVPLDADRELRIKLFIGEVPLGWLWIIPAFHMSPDSPTSTILLSNDEIDFAIGIGKALIDVKISLAWQMHNINQDSRPIISFL